MKRDKSIITDNLHECYLCKTTLNIHIHEIFFGTANRKKSIKHGLYVGLCARHHNMSNDGVHFNRELDLKLKRIGQETFEQNHTREEFIKVFGKSWL